MAIDKAVDSAKLDAKFSAIADAIRAKTGGTETMTEDEMPTKVDEVFAAGEKSEYDAFWDAIQDFGGRTDYTYAFSKWNMDSIKPKYKIGPSVTGVNSMFIGAKTKKIEQEYFDFSGVVNNTWNYTFSSMFSLLEIEDVNIFGSLCYNYTWSYSYRLITIAIVRSISGTKFQHSFDSCENLENLTIEGVIGENGFDVHWSTKLTHDSLISIISALQDKSADTSGTEWKVTLGTENLAKLSEEEISIAEEKGWVLA